MSNNMNIKMKKNSMINLRNKFFSLILIGGLSVGSQIMTLQIANAGSAVSDASTAMQIGAMAMGNNAAAGAMYAAQCSSQNYTACVMAALSFAQVGASAGAKSADSKSRSGFATGSSGWGAGLTPEELKIANDANAGLADLANKGFKVDLSKSTLTTPDGKAHSMSGLNSPKAMADAGLIGKDDVAGADKMLADVNNKLKDKYKVSSVGLSGGGGGGASSSTYARPTGAANDPFADYFKKLAMKEGANTSGLKRTIAGGDVIGVQTDDIFQMVSRKYEKENKENTFYQPSK